MGRDRDETKNLNPGYHKGTNLSGGGGGNGGGGKNRRPADGFEKGDRRRSPLDVRRAEHPPHRKPGSKA
jgi:hypothetical protein